MLPYLPTAVMEADVGRYRYWTILWSIQSFMFERINVRHEVFVNKNGRKREELFTAQVERVGAR